MNHVVFNNQHEQTMLHELKRAIDNAQSVKFIVSFIMESGVKLILENLQSALARGVDIQILTSNYLQITEPSALYLLLDSLNGQADLRIYENPAISFHPKAYILEGSSGSEVFVGSSNLSRSALVDGVEWNYRVDSNLSAQDCNRFKDEFNRLFESALPLTSDWLEDYSKAWQRKKWLTGTNQDFDLDLVEPRGPQIEALYYLKQSRAEGFSKGLVAMATGTGKTYLAAFDSKPYKKVLFMAHRQEILLQAAKSFENVSPNKTQGFFMGTDKSPSADIIFANVHTLSREEYLNPNWFSQDHFDYIVVDEFHHVAAESYARVVNYFRPRFLLGLTATPFRMDNQDIFRFCEDNLVYEINLVQAINQDYLVPFRYFGVYDYTVDYDEIESRNGKYVTEQLEKKLLINERAELVLKYYQQHKKKHCLAFCTSINHANYMAAFFNKSRVKAAVVHSQEGPYSMARDEAIVALANNEIDVLFTVDMFNEGVDIPAVEMLLFLRPTESYTVFLQQLGRGLRKHPNKSAVTVLDFIGNYKRAHWIPMILKGQIPSLSKEFSYNYQDLVTEVATDCILNIDFQVIDLFEELRKRDPLPQRMKSEYLRIKEELGKRPLRIDIHENSDLDPRVFLKKGYLRFLADMKELNWEELEWLDTPVEDFLLELEKTSMTKLYKIPTIQSFIKNGDLRLKVSSLEVGASMLNFYKDPKYSRDMQDKASRGYETWSVDKYQKLAEKNPIKYLSKSSKYFSYDEINKDMYLDSGIVRESSSALIEHIEDILIYRIRSFNRLKGEW